MNPKQLAAEAAMPFIKSGMVVGLGTGSTADYFLKALGDALAAGKLRDVRGVPTSVQSDRRARELGIPIVTLLDHPRPDVTVDGADEVDPQLNCIKGLGGALLREKIVAQATAQLIIVVDGSKAVQKLGTRSPLPVEVAPFMYQAHEPFLRSLGAEPVLRKNADGNPYVTDNGNYIYDCRFKAIEDPAGLQKKLKERAGIVESGLFINLAKLAIVADEKGVRTLNKKN
jgi:ribose 5-phosphate isomerase A